MTYACHGERCKQMIDSKSELFGVRLCKTALRAVGIEGAGDAPS